MNLQSALEHRAHSEPGLELLHKSSVNSCKVILGEQGFSEFSELTLVLSE